MKISYEQMLEIIDYINALLAKEGPLLMTRYKWARAFKELDKIKAKEKKRLTKLTKSKKEKKP